MSIQVGNSDSIRQDLMKKTAHKTASAPAQASMAEILQKMEKGDINAKTSSSVSIVKKIGGTNETSAQTAKKVLGNSDFGKNTAAAEKVSNLLDLISKLAAKGEDSLFIKSAATTQEARDAFDLSCTADGASFTMEVKQLAEAQVNAGKSVALDAPAECSVGRKHIDITVDGETASMVIKVNPEDTNGVLMNKIIRAINETSDSISATLAEDGEGMGHIVLESKFTGAPIGNQEDVFHFTNLSDDDLVELFGLNQIEKEGVNAIFNFNNTEEDSTHLYNNALVNGVTSVEFKKVTDGPIQVTFDYDYDKLSDTIESYVEAYNQLRKLAKDGEIKAVGNYFSQMQDAAKDVKEELGNIGITFDANGKMHYNSGTLYLTEMSEIKAVLNKTDGYAAKVRDVADSLNGYMDRLTGKSKKYYGLKAKKRNAELRAAMAGKE